MALPQHQDQPQQAMLASIRTLPGLQPAQQLVRETLARMLRPDPVLTVSQWADRSRYVAPEASPRPGRWKTDLVPYLREVMDCLSPSHPARSVTFKKSAQVAGTEAGINLFGHTALSSPAPMLIVLPTGDEVKKYVRVKLQPAIDATPDLRAIVSDLKSRDEAGSTTTFKKFPGGFAQVTGANSSAGLQMISVRNLILEEVSEYPFDVDGRGDPVDLALARTKAYSEERKVFYNSTPDMKGSCRISAKYEESDQRRFYVPCPHCETFQVLSRAAFRHAPARPYRAHFVCSAHGCIIEAPDKRRMIAAGIWIKTFRGADGAAPAEQLGAAEVERWRTLRPWDEISEGREPGFHIWQAYSPFVAWDDTADEIAKAGTDPRKLKSVSQQAFGEEWEERGEAPDDERLFERRERLARYRLPPGCLFCTGAVDVQGNRLEWAVYGWGLGYTSWLIDYGVIAGDPNLDATWRLLDAVVARRYEDAWGKPQAVDAWGVDAGFLSYKVYTFVYRHAAAGRLFALDGRAGWRLPPLGLPSTKDIDAEGRKIGAVQLWPVGTWDMKSSLYAALRLTIQGPDETGKWPAGAAHFGDFADRDFFRQLTAEHLAERQQRNGLVAKEWVKEKSRRNEHHDIAVYCRALAHHLADRLTAEEWIDLAARRGSTPEQAQRDLAELWAPPIAAAAEQDARGPDAAPAANAVRPDTTAAPPAARDHVRTETAAPRRIFVRDPGNFRF